MAVLLTGLSAVRMFLSESRKDRQMSARVLALLLTPVISQAAGIIVQYGGSNDEYYSHLAPFDPANGRLIAVNLTGTINVWWTLNYTVEPPPGEPVDPPVKIVTTGWGHADGYLPAPASVEAMVQCELTVTVADEGFLNCGGSQDFRFSLDPNAPGWTDPYGILAIGHSVAFADVECISPQPGLVCFGDTGDSGRGPRAGTGYTLTYTYLTPEEIPEPSSARLVLPPLMLIASALLMRRMMRGLRR